MIKKILIFSFILILLNISVVSAGDINSTDDNYCLDSVNKIIPIEDSSNIICMSSIKQDNFSLSSKSENTLDEKSNETVKVHKEKLQNYEET